MVVGSPVVGSPVVALPSPLSESEVEALVSPEPAEVGPELVNRESLVESSLTSQAERDRTKAALRLRK